MFVLLAFCLNAICAPVAFKGSDVCEVTKAGKTSEIELSYAVKLENNTTYIPLSIAEEL